jgi:hypothetical protein
VTHRGTTAGAITETTLTVTVTARIATTATARIAIAAITSTLAVITRKRNPEGEGPDGAQLMAVRSPNRRVHDGTRNVREGAGSVAVRHR